MQAGDGNTKATQGAENGDWTGVAKAGIASMAPAETGWILAVVIMFVAMTAINYFTVSRQAEALKTFFQNDHEGRSVVEEHRSEEVRRCQESIQALSDSLSRGMERQGRQLVRPTLVTPKKE